MVVFIMRYVSLPPCNNICICIYMTKQHNELMSKEIG